MEGISNSHTNAFHIQPQPAMNHNAPPQIFGNKFHSTSPVSPNMDNIASQMYTDTTALLDSLDSESNEAKRRRIARACDMCRKKKIKCDGKLPSCSHCTNYKTECIFTQVEKKRNPPKGAKYIEGLENRLGRMENLLRLSGLLGEDEVGTDLGMLEKRLQRREASLSAGESVPASPSQGTPSGSEHLSPGSQQTSGGSRSGDSLRGRRSGDKSSDGGVEDLSDRMCSLITNNQGETKYIGSSSSYSIFSPTGVKWVNEKTGDNSFAQMIADGAQDDSKWAYWQPGIFGDIFERRVYQSLPSKPETLALLKDYFENFNCIFPLFHQATFMHLVDRQYSDDPYDGSGWWASLNIALAIAHRLRVMSNLVSKDADAKGWMFLKNAMAVYPELTMRNTDLLSVQALLGMALFMQGTPNPQPSFVLVAAAIRLSHSIGLHKRGSTFNLNNAEVEQRKRVFWIGYMLDKDLCLRAGRPPAQDDGDMNVELPNADPEDDIGNLPIPGGKKFNLFRAMAEFATIQSRVYNELYSASASRQSDGELLNTIGELDKRLEQWKDDVPIDFRPEQEIKASHTPLIVHVVVLHFSYYNCLTTVHRMAVHHGYWTSRLSDFAIQGLNSRPLNPRIFSSATLCVQAARASIHLIKYVPQGDFACVWLILYFPVSALVTLFGNILQNPTDPRARSDLRLMNVVNTFLNMLCQEEDHGAANRMRKVCAEFERIARATLDKSDKESKRRKRKGSAIDESVENLPKIIATRPPPPPSPQHSEATPLFPSRDSPAFGTGNMSPHSFHSNSSPSVTNMTAGTTSASISSATANQQWMANASLSDIGADFSTNNLTPNSANSQYAADMQRYMMHNSGNSMSPLNPQQFQQPFVPPEMWQMPMTLEWDFADMTGQQFTGFNASQAAGLQVPGQGVIPGQVPEGMQGVRHGGSPSQGHGGMGHIYQ